MPNQKNLYDQLRWYVNQSGMLSREIAEGIGVSESAMSCWWHGKRGFSQANLVKLCDLLDLELRPRKGE